MTGTALDAGGRAGQRGLARLARDRSGTAIIEFAILAPTFIALIIGILEFSMMAAAQASLENGVRAASRFGLTGRSVGGETRQEAIQRILGESVGSLLVPGDIVIETLIYPSFDSVGEPEQFTDQNGNGGYDPGEPFTDTNGNGTWDDDMGAAGLGGPNDIVLYRVSYDWEALTVMMRPLFGPAGSIALEAAIAVRNEPFPS